MLRYALKTRCQTIRRYQFQFSTTPPPSLFETRKVELIDYMRKELNDTHKSPFFVRKYLHKEQRKEVDKSSYHLIEKTEGGKTNVEVPRKETNRLLAAFQRDDSMEDANDSNGDSIQYLQSLTSLSQGGSLIDLLNDDSFGKDEMELEKSSPMDTSITSMNQDKYSSTTTKSLMDLLEEDFSINEEHNYEKKEEQQKDNPPQQKSLLDLLDEDFFATSDDSQESSTQNQPFVSKTDHHRQNLMDLLDDDYNTNTGTGTGTNDGESREHQSLMDLFNGDTSHATSRNETKGNKSLMDLLDDDIFTQQNSQSHNQNTSLIDLLNDADEVNGYSEPLDTDRNKVHRTQSLMDLLENDFDSPQEETSLIDMADRNGSSVFDANNSKLSEMATSSFESSVNAFFEDGGIRDEKVDHGASASEWIEELLTGASMDKWTLSTRDYNTLLLYVITFASDFDEKVKRLISVYSQMLELQKSGIKSVSPDCNTFSILLTSLNQSNRSRGTALEICNHALSHLIPDDTDNLTESETSRIELDHDLLTACMKTLGRRRKLKAAEQLLDMALSREDVNVRPNVFRMMLDLYKTVDSQEKAIDIVRKCLYDENFKSNNLDELNSFLISAISWPLKNRQGKRVSTFSYYSELVDILMNRQSSGHFFRPQIWNKLLNTTFRLSKSETESYWHLAQMCCYALLENKQIQVNLELGLEISLNMNDPDIICRLIDKVEADPWTSNSETFRTHDEKPEFLKVPINTYMKAIKLCIETNKPSLADQILSHATRSKVPSALLTNLYTLVMTGYVQNGDYQKAEHMFHQMDLVGVSKR